MWRHGSSLCRGFAGSAARRDRQHVDRMRAGASRGRCIQGPWLQACSSPSGGGSRSMPVAHPVLQDRVGVPGTASYPYRAGRGGLWSDGAALAVWRQGRYGETPPASAAWGLPPIQYVRGAGFVQETFRPGKVCAGFISRRPAEKGAGNFARFLRSSVLELGPSRTGPQTPKPRVGNSARLQSSLDHRGRRLGPILTGGACI